MITRNGKIARLPAVVREELNQRLYNGQEGKGLVDWLNARTEVQSVLAASFDGRPITEQNLSEWRQGGYAEWEMRRQLLQDAKDMAAFGDELAAEASNELVDRLALALSARYGQLLLQWDGEVSDAVKAKIKVLGQLCKSVLGLQRGRQRGVRTRILEQRHEWEEQEHKRKEEEYAEAVQRHTEWREQMKLVVGPRYSWMWEKGASAPQGGTDKVEPPHPDPLPQGGRGKVGSRVASASVSSSGTTAGQAPHQDSKAVGTGKRPGKGPIQPNPTESNQF